MLFQSTCPARGTTEQQKVIRPRSPCISIHVPREGHDAFTAISALPRHNFNPRAPRGARLLKHAAQLHNNQISIHVPREGHDRPQMLPTAQRLLFQSTCPARGTTPSLISAVAANGNFNPRAPRGARPAAITPFGSRILISIHVPREGHDGGLRYLSVGGEIISIHVPREGHDIPPPRRRRPDILFQSTCPARGTTKKLHQPGRGRLYFNPRAPRGARRRSREKGGAADGISIHVPREGHDSVRR